MNTIGWVGWTLVVLFGAGAVWLLLFWWSFRRHATRSAAPAAVPVVPTSTSATPVVASPAATAPAPATTALPTVATPAAAPTAAATAPTTGPAASLPKPPLLGRLCRWTVWTVVGLGVVCFIRFVLPYLASKTEEGVEGLWTSAREYLAIGTPWLLALATVGGIGWVGWRVWKWWTGCSTATQPPTNPTTPTIAGAAGTPATPTATEKKAAEKADFEQRVKMRKLEMELSDHRQKCFWRFVWAFIILVGLPIGIWYIGFRKGPEAKITPWQQFVASAGTTPQELAPKRKAKWTCWPEGLNQAIVQHAVIVSDERGTSPRLVVEVEYFNYNYSNARRIVRYSWDGIAKTGTWFDEGTREFGTFTGSYDYATAGNTFFTGEKKELNGSRSRFIFDRSY